jgi:hypothetical protein
VAEKFSVLKLTYNNDKKTKETIVNYSTISSMAISLSILSATVGCGPTTNSSYFATESTVITVQTVDQFDNPVNGSIIYNGDVIGIKEVRLDFDKTQGGLLSFDSNLPGYAPPAQIDLKTANLNHGAVVKGEYVHGGAVANVCPRALNEEGVLVDTRIAVNGVYADYQVGKCQSVAIGNDTIIEGEYTLGLTAAPIFIPADHLQEGVSHYYDLRFISSELTLWVATTPAYGEIMIDGRRVGWAEDDFVQVPLLEEENVTVSFEDVEGYQTALPFSVSEEDIDYKSSHFWGLYDYNKNALVCFASFEGGTYQTTGLVLVDGTEEINTGHSSDGCIGLNVAENHTAEYTQREDSSYQSDTVLSISQNSHVGCEGDFAPGKQLDCVGDYYYVQPIADRTDFRIEVNFTAPHQGNDEYPIEGHFEAEGVQHEWLNYSYTLELEETITIEFFDIGILYPDMYALFLDAGNLSDTDEAFSPESNAWVYTIHYAPPSDAVETCVTSLNQNDENISAQVNMAFDGVNNFIGWEEDEDCHWFSATGNHIISPNWLSSYRSSVDEVYIPSGDVLGQTEYTMHYIPDPTLHELCITDITIEAELLLNGGHLGWTNYGQKCIRMDKSRPNVLQIGVGTLSWTADDPSLPGNGSSTVFSDI